MSRQRRARVAGRAERGGRRRDRCSQSPAARRDRGGVHAGDAMFVRVDDEKPERDPAVRENVDVRVGSRHTGDVETRLGARRARTPDIASGFVPSRIGAGVVGSCALDLAQDSALDVSYADPARPGPTRLPPRAGRSLSACCSDSTTGQPSSAVRAMRLVAAAGAPAVVVFRRRRRQPLSVRDDHGAGRHRSGGTTYRLPAGVYRFRWWPPAAIGWWWSRPTATFFASAASASPSCSSCRCAVPLGAGVLRAQFAVAAPVVTAVDDCRSIRRAATCSEEDRERQGRRGRRFRRLGISYWQNGGVRAAIRDVEVRDRLPRGVRFRAGTVRVDGKARRPIRWSRTAAVAALPPGATRPWRDDRAGSLRHQTYGGGPRDEVLNRRSRPRAAA